MFKGYSHEETKRERRKNTLTDFIVNHNGFAIGVALITFITFASRWQSKIDSIDTIQSQLTTLQSQNVDLQIKENTLETILENKYCISSVPGTQSVKGISTTSANLTK